jgi:RES domain-containing protein
MRATKPEYLVPAYDIHPGNVERSDRYTEKGYGAVYVSTTEKAMVAEVEHASKKAKEEELKNADKKTTEPKQETSGKKALVRTGLGRLLDYVAPRKDVKFNNVLDLTDEKTLRALNLTRENLTHDKDYLITQGIGRWAQDKYDAILVPSARASGTTNLVIFKTNDPNLPPRIANDNQPRRGTESR